MSRVDSAGSGGERGRRALFVATLMATIASGTGLSNAPAFAQSTAHDLNLPAPSVRDFDIPAQPVADALIQFGRQSGLQATSDVNVVQDLRSTAVKGSITWQQALNALLTGTGLTYRLNGTMVSVERLPPGAGANGAINLAPVQVEGQDNAETFYGPGIGYVAHQSATATKTDTPLIEVPQAVSVVTRQQMDDQNVQSVAQALRYSSGVVPEQRGSNTDSLEYIYSRGFQIEEYMNGLRLPGVSYAGYNITSFDPYLLDRIELLHGPASVLYGQASPGGLLNLESKRPTEDALHEIMLQTGSYGRAQGAVDLSGKLDDNGTLLGRLTADSFSTGTQTDHVNEKRIAIAPSITWRPDEDTSLTILGNYQHDPEAGLYNSVPAAGTILPGVHIPRNLDVGDPSFDKYSKTEESIGYSFSHRLNDTWSVYQDFRYLYNKQDIQYVGVSGVSSNGTQLTRVAYRNEGTVDTATIDNRAQAKFLTGPLQHTATVGIDWQDTEFDHIFLGGTAPNLSISNPQYNQAIAAPSSMYGTSTNVHLDQLGAYTQDQIRWGRWAYLIGIREDTATEKSQAILTRAVTKWNNSDFTWRTGLVYLFDNGLAPYISYSTSFQPSMSTGYGGSLFKPTTGQQYEAGVKYQPPGSNSFVTLSAFNLTQQNVATTDPAHTGYSIQTGEVRSQGGELEAHASLTDDLRLIGSYTFIDAKNTRSTTAPGKVPVGIPENIASAWLTYDMPWDWSKGLQFGGGTRYLGSSWGDAANTLKVPDVTLFDLAVRYDLGKAFPTAPNLHGISVSLTASNVFDKSYISYCGSATFCTYGAGRLVLANIKYDW